MKFATVYKQFLRFGVVGVTATLVYIGAGFFLLNQFGWNLFAANVGAFSCSFFVSYLGHARWVFNSTGEMKSMLRFSVVALLILIFTMLVSRSIIVLELPPHYGILINAMVIPPASFIVNKLWTFQK